MSAVLQTLAGEGKIVIEVTKMQDVIKELQALGQMPSVRVTNGVKH